MEILNPEYRKYAFFFAIGPEQMLVSWEVVHQLLSSACFTKKREFYNKKKYLKNKY